MLMYARLAASVTQSQTTFGVIGTSARQLLTSHWGCTQATPGNCETGTVGAINIEFQAASDLESTIRLLKMFMGQSIATPSSEMSRLRGNGFGYRFGSLKC